MAKTIMRKTTFPEHQIIPILKQQETGIKVADLCREHGVSVIRRI
jgi:putative transposase